MLPLIRMTWTINRRIFFQVSPLFAFYFWMMFEAGKQANGVFFVMMAITTGSLLAAIVTLQGILFAFEPFLLALPVDRSQVVRAKYLTSSLSILLGVNLPLVMAGLGHALLPRCFPWMLRAEIVGACAVACLLLLTGLFLFLPFIYRFGSTRGFTGFTLSLACLVVLAMGLQGPNKALDMLVAFSERFISSPGFGGAALATTVVLGVLSLSYATRAYRRRAF